MDDEEIAQLRQELGNRIKLAREQARNGRGFKQSEVGEALRRQNRAVSAWETGRAFPDVPILVWMARNYGVSVDELLGLKRPEPGGQWRQAAELAASACGDTKLAPADFLRIVEGVMNTPIDDESERRGFVKGLAAAFSSKI